LTERLYGIIIKITLIINEEKIWIRAKKAISRPIRTIVATEKRNVAAVAAVLMIAAAIRKNK